MHRIDASDWNQMGDLYQVESFINAHIGKLQEFKIRYYNSRKLDGISLNPEQWMKMYSDHLGQLKLEAEQKLAILAARTTKRKDLEKEFFEKIEPRVVKCGHDVPEPEQT